ncbi:unnamed protein product [Tuber aestivum]|uniref:BTB domain-containing protein n=1 Tax=Tuber aestivum TaxID=59557 RepID=A0A292Q0W6_9PEZI|nr:unnamed protein product [Tuber aestivum]
MDSATTQIIDPYGDLLVLLPTAKTKLQISSKVLSTASPVFRSMFSPRFREGAALASATKLTEIEFPDDSPQALGIIFDVLHFRHDCVSDDYSHDVLYNIALVADKYDLTRALGPWKEVWLKRGAGDGGRGLFVMYVFGDMEGFREGCRKAVIQSRGEEYDEYCESGDEDGEGDEGGGGEGEGGGGKGEGEGGGGKGEGEGGGGKGEGEGEEKGENGWACDALPVQIVELLYGSRMVIIQSLLSVTAHFRDLYQSPTVKCKTFKSSGLFSTPSSQVLTCDVAILGSLIRHEVDIGIFPTPSMPYRGISVEELAVMMKGLRCFVDFAAGHGECTITGQVIKMVDEVLASVDRLDVWDSAGGADAVEGRRRGRDSRFMLADKEGVGGSLAVKRNIEPPWSKFRR